MKIIVGLGNPGEQYKNVRHNFGFMVLDKFAEGKVRWEESKKFKSLTVKIANLILIKPQTFMNNSGFAVASAAKYFKIQPEDIIVIHDELDLPLGKIRVKKDGGSAGHHGIESIMEALGTDRFIRVRLGIGPSGGAPDQFVLDPFEPSEKTIVRKVIREAISAIDSILTSPLD